MERGCLGFTAAPSHPKPTTFLHPNDYFSNQFHPLIPSSLAAISTIKQNSSPNSVGNGRSRRSGLSIKASKQAFSAASSGKTLSSSWDVSNYTSAPSWLPRFEELDTTNMLLRQRIIFLGSQVSIFSLTCYGKVSGFDMSLRF